jgi:hypothetical protein
MMRSLDPMFPLFGIRDTRGYCQSGNVSKEYAVGKLASEESHFPRERGLDDTLAQTFPCSDPLSSIPDPGV